MPIARRPNDQTASGWQATLLLIQYPRIQPCQHYIEYIPSGRQPCRHSALLRLRGQEQKKALSSTFSFLFPPTNPITAIACRRKRENVYIL